MPLPTPRAKLQPAEPLELYSTASTKEASIAAAVRLGGGGGGTTGPRPRGRK